MVVVKEFGLTLITVNEFANIANSFTIINVKVVVLFMSVPCGSSKRVRTILNNGKGVREYSKLLYSY